MNKSSLSGRLPEDKDCISSESSGEMGFSVSARTHRRSSLQRPRPDSSPQTVLSYRTTNCPFQDVTSVAVEGSDERRDTRQRKKIPHGELRRAGLFRLPTHTRLTSMKKEERRPFPVESSGRPSLRQACPNKLRYTSEDAGEPCFSASPHRHGKASPLHLNIPLAPRHTYSQRTTNNSSFSRRVP